MNRITITIDDDLMADIDRMTERRRYANRSEAIRDLVRAGLKELDVDTGDLKRCVGVLSYVYDHEARDLSRRLTHSHHDHHDISVASLHVHLSLDRCLEVSILKGATSEVRHFADSITSQRAVAHGELKIIPDEPDHCPPGSSVMKAATR